MTVPRYDVNFVDPTVVADPYPMYEEIRSTGRVVRNDLMGVWMVPGFDDCMEALTHPERFGVMVSTEVTPWFPGTNMLMVDGAEHTRLRRCLQPMFTRQATAAWERRVYEAVDEILAPAVKNGSFDIIKDFTMIPTVVVAEMMGVSRERYEDFQHWSHTIVSNVSYGHEDPDVLRRLLDAGDQANAYLSEEIERHRREEPDDVITAMLRSNMSESEIEFYSSASGSGGLRHHRQVAEQCPGRLGATCRPEGGDRQRSGSGPRRDRRSAPLGRRVPR